MIQQEFDGLVPPRDFSGRDFVRPSVGGGFAAAVLPVAAQTVSRTDSQGLLAGAVEIPVGGFRMPAYRAAPRHRRDAPVVLLVSEIVGVHEYIADVARRLAKQCCFAYAGAVRAPVRWQVVPRHRAAAVRTGGRGQRRAGHRRPRRQGSLVEADRRPQR